MAVLCICACVLGACSPQQRHLDAKGKTPDLVLAGGGVRAENDEVLDAMVAHLKPGDSAVIVPFASGDQAGSAASAKARFECRAPGVSFEVMSDPQSDSGVVDACVKMIDRCRMVFFTGGDQSRITARLLPPNVGAPIYAALKRARARGAVFCGTSAGTAVMSSTMFTGGGSESALADLPADDGEPDGATADAKPPQRGVRLAPGLGMLGRDDVIMDSHVLRRGRFGRMVAALEKAGAKFAVGVADDCAVKIVGDVLVPVGLRSVLVLDARGAKRSGGAIREMRVSVLSGSITVDLDSPFLDREAYQWSLKHQPMFINVGSVEPPFPKDWSPKDAWDRDALLWLVDRLNQSRKRTQTLTSERFEIRLSADRFTEWPEPVFPARTDVCNAVLDIVPRETSQSSGTKATP